MVQVARKTNTQIWHIIRDKHWRHGDSKNLHTLMMQFLCEKDIKDRTPHSKFKSNNFYIEEYNKEKHRPKLCKECLHTVNLIKKARFANRRSTLLGK